MVRHSHGKILKAMKESFEVGDIVQAKGYVVRRRYCQASGFTPRMHKKAAIGAIGEVIGHKGAAEITNMRTRGQDKTTATRRGARVQVKFEGDTESTDMPPKNLQIVERRDSAAPVKVPAPASAGESDDSALGATDTAELGRKTYTR